MCGHAILDLKWQATCPASTQQKLILARRLDRRQKVCWSDAADPGVDIGAIEFIHRQIIAVRDAGCASSWSAVELDDVHVLERPHPGDSRPHRRRRECDERRAQRLPHDGQSHAQADKLHERAPQAHCALWSISAAADSST